LKEDKSTEDLRGVSTSFLQRPRIRMRVGVAISGRLRELSSEVKTHVDPPMLLEIRRVYRVDPRRRDRLLHDRRISDHEIQLVDPMLALELIQPLPRITSIS
jgi:hypothetical protein